MQFDLREVKKLIDLVEKANISELSLEEDGSKISIKKSGGLVSSSPSIDDNLATQPSLNLSVPSSLTSPVIEKAEVLSSSPSSLLSITSPMVGSYYASPKPDAPPYVKVGQKINKGDVVCIIEAMKLFNEIESDLSGIVEKLLIENGQSVEYGQELILIKPL